MDHPILQVVAEGHDTHLINDVEAARPIKVENRVERSGRKQFVVKNTDLTKVDKSGRSERKQFDKSRLTWDAGRRSTHCQLGCKVQVL